MSVLIAVAAILGFATVGAFLVLALIGLAGLGIERIQDWRDEHARRQRIAATTVVLFDRCAVDGMHYHWRHTYTTHGTTPDDYWRSHYAEQHPVYPYPGYPACVTQTGCER